MAQPALDMAKSLKILCVDDDLQTVRMMRRLLSQTGHIPICYSSPLEALRQIVSGGLRADLVISDVSMPEMNGIALFRELRQFMPHVPVIFATGNHDDIRQLGLDIAPDCHLLPKPFFLPELQKIMAKVMNSYL